MFDQLLERWKLAFDELHLVEESKGRSETFAYSGKDCFDIEAYTPENFPARWQLLATVPAEFASSLPQYGLGANGQPLYCCHVREDGARLYAGFYRYQRDALEYIEFNLMAGVPYMLQRLEFENGRKVRLQKLVAKERGAYFSGMTGAVAVENAQQDKDSVFVVERDYSYDPQGGLVEIRDVYANGGSRLRYCYWDGEEGIDALVDRVAKQMAEMVVEVLLANKVESPVAIVELSYHYADDYLPGISVVSAQEKTAITAKGGDVYEGLFLNLNDYFESDLSLIERPFTQLIQQVKDLDDHHIATGMLRKAAFLLTKSGLFGRIPVDKDFLAFAIDNSVEGHDADDFKQILLECGMEESVFNEWDRQGWMRG